MKTHAEVVQQQFDPQAGAYLTSAVHAQGADLDTVRALLATLAVPGRALDLGTGAGHLAFALAERFAHVVATDPSPAMLAVVDAAAAERGLAGRLSTCACPAERLPFTDDEFALVASRYSAHHWPDLARGLDEMHRVVAPGGRFLVIDVLGDESPLVDTHLQAMELLRDPGHVSNRSKGAWHHALTAAGFTIERALVFPLRLEFASWSARMRVPPATIDAIRRLQLGAPAQVAEALAFEPDGSFTVRTGLFWGVAGVSRQQVDDRPSAP